MLVLLPVLFFLLFFVFLTTNSHNYLLHFVAAGYLFQFVLKNSSVGLFRLLDFCFFDFLCVFDSGRRTCLHGCLCSGFYAVMKFLFMNKLFSFECGLACLICVLTGWFPSSSLLLFSVAPRVDDDDDDDDVTALIIVIIIPIRLTGLSTSLQKRPFLNSDVTGSGFV